MTDPIDLDERRALRLIGADPEHVEPVGKHDYIGGIRTWGPKDCRACGFNQWHVTAGPGGIYGSCLTPGCNGVAEI